MVTEAMRGASSTTMRSPMKALVQERYGSPDVLQVRERAVPELAEDQVLVRVRAASVNALDWHTARGEPYFMRVIGEGFRGPKTETRGADLAGVVEAVGTAVTRFKPGDEVFGSGIRTFAEFAAVKEEGLVAKPANMTFEQAATLGVAAFTALQGLTKGHVGPGQRVLVNGSGGGVGTFAVQIAKALGAEVTAVTSPANLATAREIGADHVIDYTAVDYTKAGERYDAIIDVGASHSLAANRRALTPTGLHVTVGAAQARGIGLRLLLGMAWAVVVNRFVGGRHISFLAHRTLPDLERVRELAVAGQVIPVIDRTYPLSQAAEAIRYVETGAARGKVVVTI